MSSVYINMSSDTFLPNSLIIFTFYITFFFLFLKTVNLCDIALDQKKINKAITFGISIFLYFLFLYMHVSTSDSLCEVSKVQSTCN